MTDRELLLAYMALVIDAESVSFLHSGGYGFKLTADEQAALLAIEPEAMAECERRTAAAR